LFEIVKRDGRRETYDQAKLARSLTRAGVPAYMISGIVDSVAPVPDQDTGSLRANIEAELENWHPAAARRYATTRSLLVRASEQAGYGWVCLHPETVSRLGLRPGHTVWLGHEGTSASLSVESHEDVERGQAWLNPREMAAMGARPGIKLAASSTYHETSPIERHQATTRAAATAARSLNGMAGHR